MVEIAIKNELESTERKRVRILKLFADVCSEKKVTQKVAEFVVRERGSYICLSTVHMVMEAYDDDAFANIVNNADLVVTDGMPIVWMQKLQGERNANRLRGNDLMVSLFGYAVKNHLKAGFYGGSRQTLDALQKRVGLDFPQLKVAYLHSPPYRVLTREEDDEISTNIRESGAEILFIGLGCPKQENWMAAHRDKFPAVMLGVGAAFDFYAGNLKESPAWMGKLGLEWLYRLTQEPKRLWKRYLILNPRFMWLAMRQLLNLKIKTK